ncbi:ABC transporter permease [Paenibacillus sp. HB172176]|uniref:ABC transporter permease n=1 Tax=Paenibacillus sp. HB172176 TaxID=2493690 RepID=UPI001F0D8A13|nr:ABC transporter permease [Paenibacillus sp. HB172176]
MNSSTGKGYVMIHKQAPEMVSGNSKAPATGAGGRNKRAYPYMFPWLPILLFFLCWEGFSRWNEGAEFFNPVFLPTPSATIAEGIELAKQGIILSSVIHSTERILIGFVIGCAIAILLGMVMSRSRAVENWISPILNLVGPIPALALLPFFIIWFGIGEFPKILLIAWTTFIPVLMYTLDGLKSVNANYIRSALSLGASQGLIFRKVILPSAVPHILVGMQVSLGLTFSSLIVSEMMGARTGLGYIIVDARNYFKLTNMFVAIILIGLEYSLFSLLLKWVERRLLSWRENGIHGAVEK